MRTAAVGGLTDKVQQAGVGGAATGAAANNKVYSSKFGITVGWQEPRSKQTQCKFERHSCRGTITIYNNSLAGIVYGCNGVNNGSAEGELGTNSSIPPGNTLVKNASADQ